jgi:hypothetical protein
MKNILSVIIFITFMLLGYYFLDQELFSGSEYIAFITLGLIVSLMVKLIDRIESLKIGDNEVNLSKENIKAEKNIVKLKEITDALVDSLIIPLPAMSESHNDSAYESALNFIKIYELVTSLKPLENNLISLEKIERALRDYLSGTGLDSKSRAMYSTNEPIPSPSTILNKYTSESQRDAIEKNKVYKLYESKLYPIYIDSMNKV